MSGSDMPGGSPRNGLHGLAAAGAVLLGLFLLAGAGGHIVAVWPVLDSDIGASFAKRFAVLLPGLVLLAGGMINLVFCWPLWAGTRWALHASIAGNLINAIYFGWLLARGVPEHPIGLFLAAVASYLLLLGAIRAGLVWPAARTK